MAGQTIDYDALAKQAGAISSTPAPTKASKIDYDALAKQAGAVDSSAPKEIPNAVTIPTSGVIGLPRGMTAPPGFPQMPNPIDNPPSVAHPIHDAIFGKGPAVLPKRGMAIAQESTPSGLDQTILNRAPGDLKDFGKQAVQNAGTAVHSGSEGVKNWWQKPVGEKVGSVVMSPLTALVGNDANSGLLGAGGKSLDRAVQGHPLEAASSIGGGDPDEAKRLLEQGNVGGYAWDMFGQPAALAAVAEGAQKGMGKVMEGARGERFANNNFSKLIAPGFKGDVLPYEASVTLRPLYQKEAAAMGLKDENFLEKMFTGDTPSRSNAFGNSPIPETVTGMKKAVDLSDRVVDRTHAPIDAVMQTAGADPIAPQVKNNIVNALKKEQETASRMGAKHAGAYQQLIDRVEGAKTFGEVNQIKKDANNMIEGVLHGSPSENAALSIEPMMAWKKAGDIIRSEMYPELQKYIAPQGSKGWFSVADAGRREALAMDARDGIYANYKASGVANLPEIANKYLEDVGHGSMYKTHVLRRALKVVPTPAGEFNKTFRRGLGTIGEDAQPESVTVKKQQLKLPAPAVPPPTYGGQFDIPTDVPKETTVGAPQVTPQRRYIGQREVPNPNYTSLQGPSHFQQEQELGTTAHTIPDRTRGTQSPARERADQIGMGHLPHPDSGAQPHTASGLNPPLRALTGPETVQASNWQYLTGAKEPPQQIMRNGAAVLRTGNLEIAETALSDMRKFAESKEFKALPKDEQTIHRDTLSKLEGQMKDYQKWKARNPLPPPPSKEPEFEVWLNPGVAGKISKAKSEWIRRASAHMGRAVVQKSLQQGGTPHDDMSAIETEEERLMKQPQ